MKQCKGIIARGRIEVFTRCKNMAVEGEDSPYCEHHTKHRHRMDIMRCVLGPDWERRQMFYLIDEVRERALAVIDEESLDGTTSPSPAIPPAAPQVRQAVGDVADFRRHLRRLRKMKR